MALGQKSDAVATLLDGRLFREALILAKLHAMEDSIVHNILNKWAERATMGGNLAQAAKVYSVYYTPPAFFAFLPFFEVDD